MLIKILRRSEGASQKKEKAAIAACCSLITFYDKPIAILRRMADK
jgi:hypothetical protein